MVSWIFTRRSSGEISDFLFKGTHQFKFIVGVDNANNFSKWAKHKKLLEMLPFIVVPRKGSSLGSKGEWCNNPPHKNLSKLPNPIPEISSTLIREAFLENNREFLERMLHPNVLGYATQHNLYTK